MTGRCTDAARRLGLFRVVTLSRLISDAQSTFSGRSQLPNADGQRTKLGGTSWEKAKTRVKKAMRDMADELLKLYATRQMVQGHAFSKDSPWQFEFEEAFEFEEPPSGRDHEAYLWGSPAFACARLIASSFIENGAAMEPGDHLQLDDLPAAVYDDGEGPVMKPCAETALSEAAAQRILDSGPMPLLASSRRNVVRVAGFQSIADPPRPLAGKWEHPSSSSGGSWAVTSSRLASHPARPGRG